MPRGIKWAGVPSLKGLVAPSGNQPSPRWFTLGAIVESLVHGHCDRGTVMRTVDVLYPGWEAFYRKLGIPALPRALGGSGLYRGVPRLRSFPRSVRLAAKIAVFGKGSKTSKDVFLRPWADAPSDRDLSNFVKEDRKRAMAFVTCCRSKSSCKP